ncbi:hypothetical protein [Mycolicibacterium sp. XJ870]
MTSIETLLNNIALVVTRVGASLLVIWAIYYFFTNLFGENGKDPVKMATAVGMIVLGGAAFALIPTLLDVGRETGAQITGR